MEVSQAVVAAGGCGTTTGGHVEKDFGSSGEAAATGIRQAWAEARKERSSRPRAAVGERREGYGFSVC